MVEAVDCLLKILVAEFIDVGCTEGLDDGCDDGLFDGRLVGCEVG